MISESPSTTLYTLGRGILYIGEWSGSCPPTSLTDVGSVSTLNVQVAEEKAKKYKFRNGVKVSNGIRTLVFNYLVSFILDEKSTFNMQAFLKASFHESNVYYAGTELEKEYQIRFRADNTNGPNEVWDFHRVSISPETAIDLISDVWTSLSFSGEGIPDYIYHTEDPFFNVIVGSTTTSMSTQSTTSSSSSISSTTSTS